MRPTNPRLAARSDVVWLANYAANGVATSVSVPLMITRMPVEQLGGGWAERSILSAFAEAGFTTSWISNQATAGMHDVQIANYAREASNVKFINWVNHELRGTYDSQLFKPLKAQLATGVDLQLIVLHLMGSHHVYSERYPPEQSYFGPNISDNLDNEYDDSIRHTDALLADVIETLEQTGKPAALLYASDHGELLRTSACSMQWHGFPTYENVFASAAVWLSSHPENAAFARALRLNAKLATQGKDLFDSMIEIGSLQGLKTLNSWFNIQYSTRTRSVMTMDGVIDADAKPHGACRLLTSQDP